MTDQNQQVNSILGLVKSVNWPMRPKLVNVNDMEIAKAIAKEINENGDMKDWQIVNVANLIKNDFAIYEDEMFTRVVELVRNKYNH